MRNLQVQSKNRNSLKVLVFGEILWDIVEGQHHLGGAPLNFAAHIQQCGYPSSIIAALGNDKLGREAFEMANDLNVDLSMVQFNHYPTGNVPVVLHDGQPSYTITPNVAYDYIQKQALDHKEIANHDTFYFGSLAQRNQTSREALHEILAKHSFKHIFYDVNLRKNCYSEEIIRDSLESCTILKVNDLEVKEISKMLFGSKMNIQSFSEAILQEFTQIKTVIVTAGAEGAFISSEKNFSHVPANAIEVVNTVGAGDAFSATFLAMLIKTQDTSLAASVANSVGGFVASSNKAIPVYSTEILKLLK